MKKIKLIVFDMEGTIFKKAIPLSKTKVAPSAWVAIAQSLGDKALKEEHETQVRWNAGGYSNYIQWMEETIEIHKKYNLRKTVFKKILDSILFTPSVHEVFRKINKRKIPTALISGGFKYQANKAIKELNIKHAFIGCEYFWDKEGFLSYWNLLPADYRGKRDFMRLLIKEYGISKEECLFIGDGDNDIPLAKCVGASIAFNGSKRLQKASTVSLTQPDGKENFKELLRVLSF